MRIYLTQHGEALAKDVDRERPLSEQGRADVQRLAEFLRDKGVRVEHIWHSGKTRAEQTAALIADAILPDGRPEARPGLGPNDLVLPRGLAFGPGVGGAPPVPAASGRPSARLGAGPGDTGLRAGKHGLPGTRRGGPLDAAVDAPTRAAHIAATSQRLSQRFLITRRAGRAPEIPRPPRWVASLRSGVGIRGGGAG